MAELYALRIRRAELAKTIELLKHDMSAMEASKKSLSLYDAGRRVINSRIREVEDRLRAVREEDRAALRRTKEVAADSRRAEGAKVYDAMRISRLGFRGDIDPEIRGGHHEKG